MSGLDLAVSEATLAAFLMALARTAGFVLVAPPFNTRAVPGRVRGMVAVVLALPISVFAQGTAPPLASSSLLLQALAQVVVGVSFGVVVLIAVAAVQVVGDIVDVIGGFTLSMAMDPLMMTQTSVMGRVHQLVAITLLFGSGGHLMIIHGLARGMQVMPEPSLELADLARALTQGLADTLMAGLQVAAPVVAVMLVADICLGLLTRAAPALNAFALSFPLKILLALLLVGFVIVQVPDLLTAQVQDAVVRILELSGAR